MRIATFAAAPLVSCVSSDCHAKSVWSDRDAIVILPGNHILFVSKLDWTTTYQLSLKLNPE